MWVITATFQWVSSPQNLPPIMCFYSNSTNIGTEQFPLIIYVENAFKGRN